MEKNFRYLLVLPLHITDRKIRNLPSATIRNRIHGLYLSKADKYPTTTTNIENKLRGRYPELF